MLSRDPQNVTTETPNGAESPAAWLTTDEAAAYIRRSSRTLEYYRFRGIGPPFYKPNGCRRTLYRASDLDAWLAQGRHAHV